MPTAPAAAACIIRSRTQIEALEGGQREAIIVTELPYQVNKARLIEKIAELVKEKKLEGISELRDESDKDGMRVVIELKRGEIPEVVLNHLFMHTQMQNVFGINMVALVDGQPQLLDLRQILEAFLRHRREVVTRRTIFDLRKARERAPYPGRSGDRAGEHRRNHRTDQGGGQPGRGEGRPAGQDLDSRRRHRDAGSRRSPCVAPGGAARGVRSLR
jgi:hypothetical protein